MLALPSARTAQQAHGKESGTPRHERHRPEDTLLYQLVEQHYPRLDAALEERAQPLPKYVRQEFEEYLKCGRLEHGFLRLRCEACRAEKLVAFSCKRRGFCPSCGAKRMVESAALLVDEVLPHEPMRQWVLSVPYQPMAVQRCNGAGSRVRGYLSGITGSRSAV